jgi:hypothetical protein
MTDNQNIILLLGSPKRKRSSSESFGNYVFNQINKEGISKKVLHVGGALKNDQAWDEFVSALEDAETIILTFPLYWDSLPSHLVEAFERFYEQKGGIQKPHNFYVIVHNGFPEPWHSESAIDICKCFAKKMDYRWQGALNIGGGAAIGGKPLEDTGGMTYKLRETLDTAAEAIGRGEPIPKNVLEHLSKPMYPTWFAVVLGGFGWRKLAKRRGAKTSLRSKPYEK